MTVIFFLKMLCDSALYYAFTAPLALFFGGGQLIPCMVLQSAVYALARSVKPRGLSVLCLPALAVCYYLCRDCLVDLCIITPVTCYLIWQVLRDAPAPRLEQQRELLEKVSKLLLGFGFLLMLLSGANQALPMFPDTDAAALATASGTVLSFGLIFWGSCVALLRTLRHDAEVLSQKQFHLLNLSTLVCVLVFALLLGSRWAVGLYSTALGAVYTYVLVPVFIFLSILPVAIFNAVAAFLKQLLPDSPLEESEKEINTGEFIKDTLDEYLPVQMGNVWRIIGTILLIAAVFVLLFFLIRKAIRTPRQSAAVTAQTTINFLPEGMPKEPDFGLSSVYVVRRQYRKFLKLCRSKGLAWSPGSTSLEIDRSAQRICGIDGASSQIRRIYIQARYNGHASRNSVKKMRALLAQIKPQRKPTRK